MSKLKKILIFSLGFLFLFFSVYSSWQQELVEYYPQPVLANGSNDAYYPSIVFDPSHFGEFTGDTIGSGPDSYSFIPYYKMWFSNGSGIGFAYSQDGISWTISSGGNAAGLSNPHHVAVVYESGNYYIWYWDTSQLYSHTAIRYADSADGINWSNDQFTTGNLITGVSPDWNRGSYGPCQVFYNNSASNSGTDPFNYSFFMYFDATTGGVEETGLGYSDNGINWQLHGRVLPHGNSGNWDSSYASRGTIVSTAPDEWHMWYSGGQTRLHEGIGHATSTDGINWLKDLNNPIWHINDGISYRDSRTYTPWILYREDRFAGTGDNIQFKGWFTARSGSAVRTICYLGTNQITRNSQPVAVITGPDKVCPVPVEAILSAENSYDKDGSIEEYQWTLYSKPEGSVSIISDLSTSLIMFTIDLPGEYIISLRVRDNTGEWSEAEFSTIMAGKGEAPELTISGTRNSDRSWLIRKDYFYLDLEMRESSSCKMKIKKLLVFRQTGEELLETILELLPSQFTPDNNILNYNFTDKFFDPGKAYTYSIKAIDLFGLVSAEASIIFDTL